MGKLCRIFYEYLTHPLWWMDNDPKLHHGRWLHWNKIKDLEQFIHSRPAYWGFFCSELTVILFLQSVWLVSVIGQFRSGGLVSDMKRVHRSVVPGEYLWKLYKRQILIIVLQDCLLSHTSALSGGALTRQWCGTAAQTIDLLALTRYRTYFMLAIDARSNLGVVLTWLGAGGSSAPNVPSWPAPVARA